ncbi:unnamed protein product [Cylindrotheca closterium]|uniref:Cytochrome P450 n=1 Tax=Cylindrotheca closterium TaxID=2856 RepID=A0AAD2PV48_9STRA|nr:unnamed protein product [Cylindrotheca closterium]
MPSICCCAVDSFDDEILANETTWMNLLTATGHNLWAVRHSLHSSSNTKCLLLPLNDTKKPRKSVQLVWDASTFEHDEEQGMDKMTVTSNSQLEKPRVRLPLTRCTGDVWGNHRPIVCSALANVPKLSLQATKQVDWLSILLLHRSEQTETGSNETPVPNHQPKILTVDLKQVIVEAAELWNRRLFVGDNNLITSSDEYQGLLRKATLEHWTEIRAMNKEQGAVQKSLLKLEEALPWNHFSSNGSKWQYPDGGSSEKGLVQALFESGLQPEEATDNVVSAMIASLDAVQAMVFWTLWNLSRQQGAWERCLAIGEQQVQRDLLQLSIFKKQATQGKTIQLKNPSFLVCALIETVRVYPPVWTLPRISHNHEQQAMPCKFEVLLNNCATNRQWDPSAWLEGGNSDHNKIASFGLGKRHCPAGTGGLYAAYELLRSFLKTCCKIDECQPDQALNYAYLGPTLCTHGPQLFQVTLRS